MKKVSFLLLYLLCITLIFGSINCGSSGVSESSGTSGITLPEIYRLSVLDAQSKNAVSKVESGQAVLVNFETDSSDTFEITNEKKTVIEISRFELGSRVSVYSDSDYELQKASREGSDTETALTVHFNINTDIILRGDAASADSTTFVGFYIESWYVEKADDPEYQDLLNKMHSDPTIAQFVAEFNAEHPDDPITSSDSWWYDLFVINRDTSAAGPYGKLSAAA